MKTFKILLLTAIAVVLTVPAIFAVPACPDSHQVHNADGSTVTLVLHGDEFYNFTTTTDGYTVLKNSAGNWVYATADADGSLKASAVVAHDLDQRSAAEMAIMATTMPLLTDSKARATAKKARAKRENTVPPMKVNFNKPFKGLVVLCNFSDRAFRTADIENGTPIDIRQFYDQMLNTRNYTGYTSDNSLFNKYGQYTGSVRDYFYDNSLGQFDPQFDVIGPVDMSISTTEGRYNSFRGFREVYMKIFINEAEKYNLNWDDYDNDGDNAIDLIYFIVPGFGSNYSGNNSDYLWPHASGFYTTDYQLIARFACSTEYYGVEEGSRYIPDGIGTICHEFSHCLGVKDLYDSDYEKQGQSNHPSEWSVMAGGSYKNFARTPVGYSLYERYAMGFANPTVLKTIGTYTLPPFGESNQGFIIETPNAKEKFLLDNRQTSSKWDAYLSGHGMIVARMDSTNVDVWTDNTINCDPTHNYYELLRAGTLTGLSTDVSADPFPGTASVTEISGDNSFAANLLTWDGKDNNLSIKNISEDAQGNISFGVGFAKTTPFPLTIGGHQLNSNTDYNELAEELRAEGLMASGGSINYDPLTNTLALNDAQLLYPTGRRLNNIVYNPDTTTFTGLSDTLHIAINGNVTISNNTLGGMGLNVYNTHVILEGTGSLNISMTNQVSVAIYLHNTTFEICGQVDLTCVDGAYGLHGSPSSISRFIVNDNHLAYSPKITLRGRTSSLDGIAELKLGNGYAITAPEDAIFANNQVCYADSSVVKGENVVIEQAWTPIALNGSPLPMNVTADQWDTLNNLFKTFGILNGDGYISFDQTTHTLILNNAHLKVPTDEKYHFISNGYYHAESEGYMKGYNDFKIQVIGDCKVEAAQYSPLYSYYGQTTVTGTGTLTLTQSGALAAVRLGTSSTLNLGGADVNIEVNTSNVTIRGASRTKLTFSNQGTTTISAPNGRPWLNITSVRLLGEQAILQPVDGYLSAQSGTMSLLNADGSLFSGGTAIIGIPNNAIYGDVDGNSIVDITDVNILLNIILGRADASDYSAPDVDQNTVVDITDLNIVINIILGK